MKKEDRYEIQMRFVLEKELQKKEKRKMHIQWRNSIKVFPILKHDNFVVITLDKETNQLLSCLMWKDERERKTLLSRDQCLDKALQFWEAYYMQEVNQLCRIGIIMKSTSIR